MLQVDGHMEMEGSLTNAGTVNNTSANTLQIGGDLDNAGTLENRTGRLIVKGAFLNSGTLSTGNTVEKQQRRTEHRNIYGNRRERPEPLM